MTKVPHAAKAKKAKTPNETAPVSHPRKRRKKIIFFALVGFLLILFGGSAAYAFYISERMLPNTRIAGVPVGGLKKSEAIARVESKEKAFLSQELHFTYEDKEWKVPASELGIEFDHAAVIDQAYGVGKTGSTLDQVEAMLLALVTPGYFEVEMTPLTEANRATLAEKVLKHIEVAAAETSLQLTPGKVSIVPGKIGKKLDYDRFETDLYRSFKSGGEVALQLSDFAPQVSETQAEPARQAADELLSADWKLQAGSVTQPLEAKELATWISTIVAKDEQGMVTGLNLTLNEDLVKKRVTALAAKANSNPVNARLKADSNNIAVVQGDKDGITVDVPATAQKITATLLAAGSKSERTLVAITKVAKADLRADTIESLGLKQMIGSATTDYKGSPSSRVFNITKGQQSLNGILVKPGETFSTLGSLGPINGSTGYVSALVIKEGRTIPDYGGGLCQVSTTLFRAVLNAGMPVTERQNHAYRVSYYEVGVGPGLDATIFEPKPDFKWKNDSATAIYLQSYIVGTKITFELYGTSDGRVASISTPQIISESPPGDTIYQNTDTLFKGETKQIETAHSGARTTATYVVTRDGQEINRQVFNSNYRPWPAQYLVGTKERVPQ